MNDLLVALKRISYALFTKRCALCGAVIELDDELCDDCKKTERICMPICTHCGCAVQDCACNKNKNEYKQIVAPYYYEDSIVRAVYNFKDGKMPFLSKKFAEDMLLSVNECYADIEFDYITFVPLRALKKLKRGYNQSELLCNDIAKSMGIEALPLLKKVHYTGIQHHKSAKERRAAVFGAYDVADKYKNCLTDKTILIVDDVKTTGSTLNECAKMLKIYGAKAVYAVSFAITKKSR